MNLLEKFKQNSDVQIMSKDGLHIVKYKDLGVDWSNEDTRIARGIILNDLGEVVARPFDKFFNMNELVGRPEYTLEEQRLSMIDAGPIEVTDKRDGSLVIMFNHNGELKIASSGSLDGEYISIFKRAMSALWTKETYEFAEELSKKYTLLFEYTAPDNQVVIEYEEDKLALIGMRETATGRDFTMKEIKEITKGSGFEYAEVLSLESIEEIEEYLKNTPNIEGVVVLFTDTMKRVKIKTQEYFAKHKDVKGFALKREGLSSSQKSLFETMMLEGKEGDIEDLIAKFRGKEIFKDVVAEVDVLKSSIVNFMKDLDVIKKHNSFDVIEGQGYVELKNSESILGVPALVWFFVEKEISSFWKAQEDYEAIMKFVKGTVHKKLASTIKAEVGVVANYSSKISVGTFIDRIVDKKKIWRTVANLY